MRPVVATNPTTRQHNLGRWLDRNIPNGRAKGGGRPRRTSPRKSPTLSLAAGGKVKNDGSSTTSRMAFSSVTPSCMSPRSKGTDERLHDRSAVSAASGPRELTAAWSYLLIERGLRLHQVVFLDIPHAVEVHLLWKTLLSCRNPERSRGYQSVCFETVRVVFIR